jgi:hypothetical protein
MTSILEPIPLRAALPLLLPELWNSFCAKFRTEESALQDLDSDAQQFLTAMAELDVMNGRDVGGTSTQQAARGALSKRIVDLMRDMLVSGHLTATGMQPGSLARIEIPAELWTDLKFDFAQGTAVNSHFSFLYIQVATNLGSRETRIAACQAWLKSQPRQAKKILEPAAIAEFPGLASREYSAAYAAAYNTKPGRPRKTSD